MRCPRSCKRSPSVESADSTSVDEAAKDPWHHFAFPRRLIAERRIKFVRVGRHVRIPAAELQGFIAEGTVEPLRLYPSERA